MIGNDAIAELHAIGEFAGFGSTKAGDAQGAADVLPILGKPRTAIVAAARGYLGTPWIHTQRVKGVGIDCAGLLICVSNDLGMPVENIRNYTWEDEFPVMIREIERYAVKIDYPNEPLQYGDILVFRGRMMYNHCGFFTPENNLLHAYRSTGVNKVVETPMDAAWYSRINSVYRYNGITD